MLRTLTLMGGVSLLAMACFEGPGEGNPGGGAPAAPAAPFYDGHPDAAVKEFAKSQGWKDVNEALSGVHRMHTDMSGMVRLPGADAKPEDIASFHKARGVPDDPAAYVFDYGKDAQGQPLKADPKFETFARGFFKDLGLPQADAQRGVNAWQKFVGEMVAEQAASEKAAEEQAIAQLKTIHGDKYDGFIAEGKKAFSALGLPPEVSDAIEKAAGTSAYLTLMSALGAKMGGEGGLVIDNSGGDAVVSAMSPTQAQAEIQRLSTDKDFQEKYTKGDKASVDKMLALHARAASSA